jgi:16S rRNA (cytosine1402-N4)-methyltransferase
MSWPGSGAGVEAVLIVVSCARGFSGGIVKPGRREGKGNRMHGKRRSTPAGSHRPVLLAEVLEALALRPGAVVVDCTTGWAGHSRELLRAVQPDGRLVGLDLDPENLVQAREQLAPIGNGFTLVHRNFAALDTVLAELDIAQVDGVLADLGMSSMQIDDAERGFSYSRDGPLDMRMDRTRGRTAAQLLATLPEAELARALAELGDEPHAAKIAAALVRRRETEPLTRTKELADFLVEVVQGDQPHRLRQGKAKWQTHPAARTFQALRILVNRELASLDQLLRVLPGVLKPGGVAALISFHSGEDRRIKAAFRDGKGHGVYSAIAEEPIRPGFEEKTTNPRSRSAKLRWARRGS